MSRLILFGTNEDLLYAETSQMETEVWEKYRRNALRYLHASGASPSTISTLEHLPFACEGIWVTDDFNGTFPIDAQLLMLRVPVEVFVEIENERGSWNHRRAQDIPEVVSALNRVG